ncbi:hypothetical protein [Streptomyces sp. NPDC056361]|uniref:hypothetical protein n=1 Tax=Streptomyces sp. NPDC056361 TaxID=3345795 RepID=UPI0035DA9682
MLLFVRQAVAADNDGWRRPCSVGFLRSRLAADPVNGACAVSGADTGLRPESTSWNHQAMTEPRGDDGRTFRRETELGVNEIA